MFSIEATAVRRWLTGVILCLGAGALTYQLAQRFGTEDPITLAVMVILAELFLGSCIFLGLFITTRMSETMMLDPVHEVQPQAAPTVWAPRPNSPATVTTTPADRRVQLYLRRVLHECESPRRDARTSDQKRPAGDGPKSATRLKRA